MAGVALIRLAGGTLGACGRGGSSAAGTARPSPVSPSATACPSGPGCPVFAYWKSDFCELQSVRDMLADGSLREAALPRWADRTRQDGVAVVIDFGRPLTVSPDRRLDQLDAYVLTPRKLTIRRSTVRYCLDRATAEDFAQNRRVSPEA